MAKGSNSREQELEREANSLLKENGFPLKTKNDLLNRCTFIPNLDEYQALYLGGGCRKSKKDSTPVGVITIAGQAVNDDKWEDDVTIDLQELILDRELER